MSTLPQPSRPAANPSTGSLPPLSAPKSRKSLPVSSDHARAPSPSQISSKIRASPSPRPSLNKTALSYSASNLSSSRSISAGRTPSSPDKSLRRTISIAAFPQPPKTGSRPSTASSISGIQSLRSSGSVKVKRNSRLSVGTSSSYRSSQTPSLLNGGDNKSIVSPEARDPEASPSQSRSSSAQGSYSTSATTFEDADDVTGALKPHSKPKEAKGNVIVSVRVRPDVHGTETSKTNSEWAVDARHSLITFSGKEGGDYYYGNNSPSANPSAQRLTLVCQITSSLPMNITPKYMTLRQNVS